VDVLGLILGIGALIVGIGAWRAARGANRISAESTEIAQRALAISEAEHEQRELERKARARLAVDVEIVAWPPDVHGITRLGGSHANLRLKIAIANDGDRDAGRSKVEVTFPMTVSDISIRWTDPSGRELPDYPERAARIDETNVLSRTLDGIGRDLGETLYVTFPVEVPMGDNVNDYPIRVRVAAEGADGDTVVPFRLKVGRAPGL
jgi:hypothetical protein